MCIRDRYKATLTAQTEEFFSENLGERDLVVYNYQAYYFNYKYYFPEERLFYVRDVDLSRDFDRIWFLDTEMEWDFVPDQIIPYQLQIEYVGHYGIEDNEFDLYQVTLSLIHICGTACGIEGLFFGENSSGTERFSSARSAHLPR